MQRLDFLCVLAGTRRIAMPLNLVLSVEEAGPLTPLPFSPPMVEGLGADAFTANPLLGRDAEADQVRKRALELAANPAERDLLTRGLSL